ncbi:MAG: PAS domain-containing sensor histidine kinase, partial [Proteobacteria bacterium]|nr:PAS domain-containing sensor histidine kinase [Pseudomonadota bacterium]
HGRFRFVNKTLADWLQVMPEDLVKGDVRVHDVMVDPPKAVSAHAIAAGAHGELRGEIMLRRRDGQIFPAAIAQTVVIGDDGKTLRTRSVVRDLTPEREWQQALNVSESRFQHLFAEAPIGVVLLDKKFGIVECNQSFQSLMRRGREALIGINISDLMVPNDRHAALDQLSHVLKGADLYKPVELRMAAPREVVANVYVKRFNAISGQGDAEGLMLYFIDATEQRRLESQFAQSQKMQAIGQLAGGVAHDFNNLLTAMIGFCDLLLQRHKPGDQSFSDIMQIKQNGNRAANLVRQLLAFSRQQTLQPKVINLIDVLSELSNLLRRLIGASIKLDVSHGRDLGLVKVDQGQLEQVIINLVV